MSTFVPRTNCACTSLALGLSNEKDFFKLAAAHFVKEQLAQKVLA